MNEGITSNIPFQSLARRIEDGCGRGLRSYLMFNIRGNVEWIKKGVDTFLAELNTCTSLEEFKNKIADFFALCCENEPRELPTFFRGLISPIHDEFAEEDIFYDSLVKQIRPTINKAISNVYALRLKEMSSGKELQTLQQFLASMRPFNDLCSQESPFTLNETFITTHASAFIEGVKKRAERNEYTNDVHQAVLHGYPVEPIHLHELLRLGIERPAALQMMKLDEIFLTQAQQAQSYILNIYAFYDARSPLSSHNLLTDVPINQEPLNTADIFKESASEIVIAFSQLTQIFQKDAGLVRRLLSERILSELKRKARKIFGSNQKDYIFLSDSAKLTLDDTAVTSDDFLKNEEKNISFQDRIDTYIELLNLEEVQTIFDKFERDFEREFLYKLWYVMEANLKTAYRRPPAIEILYFLRNVVQKVQCNLEMTNRMKIVLERLLGNNKKLPEDDFVDYFLEEFFVQEANQSWAKISRVIMKYQSYAALPNYFLGKWNPDDINDSLILYCSNGLQYEGKSREGAVIREITGISPYQEDILITQILQKRYPDAKTGT